MSDFSIRDGTGRATRAAVTERNELRTFSVLRPEMHAVSGESNLAFVLNLGLLSIPATEAMVLQFEVGVLGTKNLVFSRAFYGWNGGDTNFNRSVITRLYVGTPAPTANHTAVVPGNMKIGSSIAAPVTAYKWNGSGSGMTVASNGVQATTLLLGQGLNTIDYNDALIIPAGAKIGLTVQGDEAGKFTGILLGFWE